ncbi:cytochrome c biogenesis protein CcsA [Nocardioides terrisoli]|uniref:cytochrome c biogenesis protein CcsA n=1 Tax=Nocardioides terrisoli TaxID=3388267 RepID=UPI00287BA408|nr:cytochrome c biogenesis protein CcsA [Nocardioides marmorisolisilvae]
MRSLDPDSVPSRAGGSSTGGDGAVHRGVRPDMLLGAAVLLCGAAALVLGLVVAPPDSVQGNAQRLMYVHVPSAWTGFLAVGLMALASLMVVLVGSARWDRVARAAAELGTVAMALAFVEGSVWGQRAWGVWWTWDPRLVTTAVLVVSLIGLLAFRGFSGNDQRARRRTAVLGLVISLEVPVVHLSVLWWRSIHQPPTLLRPSLSDPIDHTMLLALAVSMLTFTLAGIWWLRRRYHQLTVRQEQVATGVARLRVLAQRCIPAGSATEDAVRNDVAASGGER